jgi:hypothetical protein
VVVVDGCTAFGDAAVAVYTDCAGFAEVDIDWTAGRVLTEEDAVSRCRFDLREVVVLEGDDVAVYKIEAHGLIS